MSRLPRRRIDRVCADLERDRLDKSLPVSLEDLMERPERNLMDSARVLISALLLRERYRNNVVASLVVLVRLDLWNLTGRRYKRLQAKFGRLWVEGELVRYQEVLRVDGIRQDDRDVLLDRLRGAIAKTRDQFVKPLVALGRLRLAELAFTGVLPTLALERLNAARLCKSMGVLGRLALRLRMPASLTPLFHRIFVVTLCGS
jgi:hypothetical protein